MTRDTRTMNINKHRSTHESQINVLYFYLREKKKYVIVISNILLQHLSTTIVPGKFSLNIYFN